MGAVSAFFCGFETFEEYCRERWEFTKTYANYLVDSSNIVENLTTIVVKPERETHVRPLSKLEPEKNALQVKKFRMCAYKCLCAFLIKTDVCDNSPNKGKNYKSGAKKVK